MKPLVLAAALVALSAPVAFADSAPKKSADHSQAQSQVPDAVKTYVMANVGAPFPYQGAQIVMGKPVMDTGVFWQSIPNYPQYRFANLGGEVVVIENTSRKVVAIY
jgi:hypothetical protein